MHTIAFQPIVIHMDRRNMRIFPREPDLLSLCEQKVRTIEAFVNDHKNLLNEKQCQDLSSKLFKTVQNVQELVIYCGAISANYFRATLENLCRCLEKATLLVNKCGEEDWCAASIFQCQNENAFREILLDVSLSYNAIYAQATAKFTREERDIESQPEDLRKFSVFQPASISDIRADQELLRKRLQVESNGSGFSALSHLLFGRVPRNQRIAKHLLLKLKCTAYGSRLKSLDVSSGIVWGATEIESSGTWGSDKFLGNGSGGCVSSTTWLGIQCAKKVIDRGKKVEKLFLKEAGILAHVNHPRIVKFVCCGNGQEKGQRFIAMELVENSLADVIEDQGDLHFPLPTAVDIMVQMARGMCYLHDKGVAHRDLKPHNVVVNRSTFSHLNVDYFDVKLVDFGVSKTEVDVLKAMTMSAAGIGTTQFRAPEVHPKAHTEGKGKAIWFKADVYSFAVTCAHLLSLKPPFGDRQHLAGLYEDLMNGVRPELPTDCPEALATLLRDCWDTDQRSRPSFMQILTRLERFRHKLLRGISSLEQGSQEEEVDLASYEFIQRKLEEHSYIQRAFVASADNDEIEVMNLEEQSSIPSQFAVTTEDEVVLTILKSAEVDSVNVTMSESVSEANQRMLIHDKSLRTTYNVRIATLEEHTKGASESKSFESVPEQWKSVLPVIDGMFAKIPRLSSMRDEEKYAHLQYRVKPASVGTSNVGSINIPLGLRERYLGSNRRLAEAEFHPPPHPGGGKGPWIRPYSSATWAGNAMIKDAPLHLLPRPQHPWSLTPLPRFLQGCSIPPPVLRVSLLSLIASHFAPELQLPNREHAIQGEDVVKFSWQ